MQTSRGLLIGVILLAVLAGAVYWSNKSEAAKEAASATEKSKDAPPKLITIADDSVKQVQVKKADSKDVTVIARGDNGRWTMQSPKQYPVDQDSANGVVSALTGLTWDRLVEEKATDLAGFGLATPKEEVTVTGKDGKTQKLLIGDDTPTSGTVYAKLDGDPRVFTLFTSTKASFEKTADDLRDKRLMPFDSEKVSRIEFTGSDKDKRPVFELGKNAQNEWQIVKPKPFRADGFQVEELIRHLKDAKMDPESDKPNPKLIGGGIATVKVTENTGTYTLEVKKNYKENIYFAKSSTMPGLHKLSAELGEGFEKNLDSFRSKKLFDFGYTELSKIELRNGNDKIVLEKSGSDWKKNGQTMDPVSVQNAIDKLRDLAAVSFEDKPIPPKIDLEIRVNWADGKRSEHILMSKVDSNYVAQRENEPVTYDLTSGLVETMLSAFKDVKPPQKAK